MIKILQKNHKICKNHKKITRESTKYKKNYKRIQKLQKNYKTKRKIQKRTCIYIHETDRSVVFCDLNLLLVFCDLTLYILYHSEQSTIDILA